MKTIQEIIQALKNNDPDFTYLNFGKDCISWRSLHQDGSTNKMGQPTSECLELFKALATNKTVKTVKVWFWNASELDTPVWTALCNALALNRTVNTVFVWGTVTVLSEQSWKLFYDTILANEAISEVEMVHPRPQSPSDLGNPAILKVDEMLLERHKKTFQRAHDFFQTAALCLSQIELDMNEIAHTKSRFSPPLIHTILSFLDETDLGRSRLSSEELEKLYIQVKNEVIEQHLKENAQSREEDFGIKGSRIADSVTEDLAKKTKTPSI